MSVAEATEVKENLYEGMFLVDSNAYTNDPDAITAVIMEVLEKAGATVVAHRPWQDGKLAYEIEGRRKGTHYIVCFRMPPSGMDVLTRQCHLSNAILRQMVVRQTQELFDAVVGAISGTAADAEAEVEKEVEKKAEKEIVAEADSDKSA